MAIRKRAICERNRDELLDRFTFLPGLYWRGGNKRSSKRQQGTSHSALRLSEVWRPDGARPCFILPLDRRRAEGSTSPCIRARACKRGCVFMHGAMYQQVFFMGFFVCCFFLFIHFNLFSSQKRFDFIAQLTKGDEQTRVFLLRIRTSQGNVQIISSEPPPDPTCPKYSAGGNTHTWLSVQSNKPIVTVLVTDGC